MKRVRPFDSARFRSGFTLVEVLLSILLLGLGLLAVLGLTLSGTRDATQAMAMATAYSTARSAMYDPKAIDPTKTASDATVTGYLNGYYVVRTIEESLPLPSGGGTTDRVRVDVYWGNSGDALAGLTSYLRR